MRLQVYYGCYETCTPGEIAVVAERAAMNMAYQGLTPEFGVANMVPPRLYNTELHCLLQYCIVFFKNVVTMLYCFFNDLLQYCMVFFITLL